MNYGFIKPEVMKKYIIDRLQEWSWQNMSKKDMMNTEK